ncbi:glycine-rich protein DOT1 isoform X7 [Thunnus maccoyii]|uniref:glycine-rich protein DOT1 isoform X7 n=1 Tax=Thunnus maccoyii TaxID=8240 RepID=UPI001C4BB443|nr:glycine-rich protein DOT1 isoform X7 [Thunnus maccoyii]
MLVPALLQTSLILWLAQQTLQGGVKPQSVAWGRMLPARGVGIGVKPGAGALGALGSRYGSKAMKTGIGRYPAAQPGAGGYRALGVGGRTSLKQGGYVPQGANGASLGLGAGLPNGLGMGLGQGGKRVYGAGVGTLPGYGTVPGMGQPAARSGYNGGVGTYPGAGLGPGGYGPGLGQGAYLGGAAGKLGAAALGQGGYPHGVAGKSNGYGDGAATGYLGPMAANGYGYPNGNGNGNGNGYGDGYGAGHGYPSELADVAENKAGKSQGAYAGQPQAAYGPLGAGLESPAGKYGGGAAQVPYGGAPVIPTGLEGDVGYPYGAQHLGPVGESAKASNKNGAGAGYGVHQTGYGAQLGATQDVLGEPVGKYGGANGNGYKG